MDDTNLLSWPRFALRPIMCPEGTPVAIRQLLEFPGVPERSVGGEYVALGETAQFIDSECELLAFGVSGPDGRVCLNIQSLEVVHIPILGVSRVNPVNANLAAFIATVQVVISQFPYYTYETAEERGEVVAATLHKEVSEIDSSAFLHNGLWGEFLDDVAMGNYVEEEFEPAPGS